MDNYHCTYCGSDQLSQTSEQHLYCQICHYTNFVNPVTAVGIYLINPSGQVCLCERKYDPDQWKYDEAWGFCDIGDSSCEHAIIREVQEELWLSLGIQDMQYFLSRTRIYPYQGRDIVVMCVLYYAYLTRDQIASLSVHDDVASIRRFDPLDIDPQILAHGQQAIQTIKIVSDIISRSKS